MTKQGIRIEIPGFGNRTIRRIVSDYSGTLSCAGKLVPGVREKLTQLLELVDIHVVSSDSFGTAKHELVGVAEPHILSSAKHDVEKEQFARAFDLSSVVAFGNGNNDRLLLKAVRDGGGLAIAVDNGEGCAVETLLNAQVFIVGAPNALNLLLEPRSLKATLRF